MKRTLTMLFIGALALGACNSDARNGDGPLIVYSGRSEELVKPLIDQFEESTGIEVEVRYAGSTELAATLLAEGESTDADVFFAQDPASLGSVKGILIELSPDILDQVDERFADSDGKWIGVSGRVRVFVHDAETTKTLPQSIDDVVENPEWVGDLGVAPTNGSFLAFVAAMVLERGEDATLEWLEKLAAAQPTYYEGNSPIVAAVDSGEIGAGLVNHYYLLQQRAEGAGAGAENWFIPAGDVGSLVMPAGAGIIAGTDHPVAAQQFVTFLLSEQAQEYFVSETFEYSLTGLPANPDLPDIADIQSPDIDLSRLAETLATATRLIAEAGLV
ncbi:MAG: extracellular solute-binding protein [Acidimicrobiia bacterium]|nr:extracellular solute-binding protein [Acidimicrobiia bacterium]